MANKKPSKILQFWKTKAGKFDWHVIDRNGNIVAQHGQGYERRGTLLGVCSRTLHPDVYCTHTEIVRPQ